MTDFSQFPLTDFAVMPIHGGAADFGPGRYFACADVDGEWDYDEDLILYDWRCQDCVQQARENLWAYGDYAAEWRPALGAEPIEVTLGWLIERSNYWLGVP